MIDGRLKHARDGGDAVTDKGARGVGSGWFYAIIRWEHGAELYVVGLATIAPDGTLYVETSDRAFAEHPDARRRALAVRAFVARLRLEAPRDVNGLRAFAGREGNAVRLGEIKELRD